MPERPPDALAAMRRCNCDVAEEQVKTIEAGECSSDDSRAVEREEAGVPGSGQACRNARQGLVDLDEAGGDQ
jgi:hypothetical protein